MSSVIVDFGEINEILDNLAADLDAIIDVINDPSFVSEVEQVVADDMQEVFLSGGSSGGYAWPSGVTGIDTGDLMDSWTVGGIDVMSIGDTLFFTTSVHEDYGTYFHDNYGYLAVDENPSIADVFSSWLDSEGVTTLKWERG
jgi:hypothetical protein